MKYIVATKQYMTQIFDNEGRVQPVTVLKAEPLTVAQVRTVETDGYSAVQLAYSPKAEGKLNQPMRGHLKDLGGFARLVEQTLPEGETAPERGSVLSLEQFTDGESIDVRGISKGKGFQGVVKRHGFGGGRRSHGQKHSEREPGSIGGGGRAGGRVAKGLKMAGRMGGDAVTVKNLILVKVDNEAGLLYVRGAVPGRRGTELEVFGR